ncbi:MAG: helix-turn-helix domain-containing protein [Bacteroidetes Order II. Incertae sedis bacterium]|nr:helix-turn-helix domain-containing protein [Bacteroidetes Order II. bacterium]
MFKQPCILGVLLTFSSVLYGFAQPNRNLTGTHLKRVWTTADGLPVNHANDVEVDRQGFVWIATVEGLVRFDGFTFFVYNRDNTPVLSSNRILSIFKTNEGIIFSTQDNVHYLYQNGKIEKLNFIHQQYDHRIQYHEKLNLLYELGSKSFSVYKSGIKIFSIAGDYFSRGVLSDDGVYVASSKNISFYHFPSNSLRTIYELDSGYKINHFSIQKDLTAFVQRVGKDVMCLEQGGLRKEMKNVFVVREGKKNYVSEYVNIFQGNQLLKMNRCNPVTHFELDASVNPLFSAYSQFVRREIDQKNTAYYFGNYFYINDHKFDFIKSPITGIIKDINGNYLVTTSGGGLLMYYTPKISNWAIDLGEASNIYSIFQLNKDVLLIGTNLGYIYKFDNKTMASERFVKPFSGDDGKPFKDANSQMWLIHDTKRCKVNAKGIVGTCLPPLPFQGVFIIEQAPSGHFWVATGEGLYTASDWNGAWQEVRTTEGEAMDGVYRISFVDNGEVWFGRRDDGLFRFRKGKGVRVLSKEHPCGNQTREIISDGRHHVWVGTESQGICHIALSGNGQVGRATQIKKQHGLFSQGVHRMIDDYMGRYWMNSNFGVFWVSKRSLYDFVKGRVGHVSSVAFGERDGLVNREGNGGRQNSGIYTMSGKILFPTQNGIVEIDPRQIPFTTAIPSVYLVSVDNLGRRYMPDAMLALPATARDLTFHYSAIEMVQPHNVVFRYRLQGYDESWRPASQIRFANYTNLRHGSYTFELQAGIAGNFSGTIFQQTVSIAPFWFETWWFYGFVLFGIALFGNGWLQFRTRNISARARELEANVTMRTLEITHQQALLSRQNRSLQEQTEQIRQQAAQLQEIDKAKSRLFINLAHEFRTPLTVISTPVEAYLRRKGNQVSEDQHRLFASILRNSNRLLELVNQLLEIARLESGMVPIRLVDTDLPGFVRDWIEGHFREMATEKHIRIRFEAEPLAFQMGADTEKLGTILSNLLSNAIKFTPPEGLILVQVRGSKTEGCQICVTDSGAGIPENEIKRVFDWYYRASMHEIDHSGTGIGLSLSRELAFAMGGDLVATSKLGEGARFCLSLPFVLGTSPRKIEPEPFWTPQEMGAPSQNADLPLVLIVEDQKEIATLIADGLAEEYRTIWAENGAVALKLLDEHLPDLIIADVMMPIMDGWRFVQHVRNRPIGANLPIVMLTARADEDGHRSSLKYGADVYFKKPFVMDVLLLQIHNLLGQRKELARKLRMQWLAEQAPKTDIALPEDENAVFLQTYEKALTDQLGNPDFDADQLADILMMSRAKLFQKVKQLTNETPTHQLNRMRMEEALRLLEKGVSVTEVAFAVGYHSLAGFSKAFKAKYGISPSEFRKNTFSKTDHSA